MSTKYCKVISLIVAMAITPVSSHALDLSDYIDTDSWKSWGSSIKNKVTKTFKLWIEEDKENSEDKTSNENPKEDNNQDKDAEETRVSMEDFYDNLDIKLVSEKLLKGGESTLKKSLISRLNAAEFDSAVAFFVSLEKKNHDVAISILDSIEPEYRLILLQQCPPAFIAKILVDMRNKDFKGKPYFRHWGPFTVHLKQKGTKDFENAEIKGDSISLRYINFLLSHKLGSGQKAIEEMKNRGEVLADIMSFLSGPDLASLLVYSPEEVFVRMGEKHELCYGDYLNKGICFEEVPVYLPEKFVGQFLSGLHRNRRITTQDINAILEAEFKVNPDRYKLILKHIPAEVVRDIALDFSEDMWLLLPEDVQHSATMAFEEKEREMAAREKELEMAKMKATNENNITANRINSTLNAKNGTVILQAADDNTEEDEEKAEL